MAAPFVPEWKAREANASADLTVTRLKIERREELRRYREEGQRRVATQRAEADARAAELALRAQREAHHQRQRQQIDSFLRSARLSVAFEPSDVRAEVERFLAQHATPSVSVEWMRAEVAAIRDRRRVERDALAERQEEEARRRRADESKKSADALRRAALLAYSGTLTRTLTADRDEWDKDAATEAMERVRECSIEDVDATWDELRVAREVRDILSEWD